MTPERMICSEVPSAEAFSRACAQQALDQSPLSPHTNLSCGQSRSGGFTTSNRTRRSRFLGRVAVAYVQGSPKGGGALCVRRVVNTRLRPVPPFEMEVTMRRKAGQIFTGLLIAALSATPAATQTQTQIEKRYTRDYSQCMDASEGVTSAMMDCIGMEIERQDARLNQAYVMVMRPLPRAKKDNLRGLQRAWINQRDARCQRAIADEGGSMAGIIYSGCIITSSRS